MDMARKDHYVSQTYLRHFASSNGDLVPYYKNAQVVAGKAKVPKSICFETEGDTNKYFQNPRILDEFLPAFENTWNSNIARLENQELDEKAKFEIAGYIAFLRACTPTAKRLNQQGIAGILKPVSYEVMLSTLEKGDYLKEEEKSCLYEAIQKGELNLKIDREFAHAQGMQAMVSILCTFYCSDWLVLFNKTDIPFITSDNPAIFFYQDMQQQIANTYVPLKPTLALLITPNIDKRRANFEDVKKHRGSKDGYGVIKPPYVKIFNEAIVKSAEKIVLHQKKEEWLEKLVRKYSKWGVETIATHIPIGEGTLTAIRQQSVKRQ